MKIENTQYPLLALRGILVLPSMVIHIDVGREKSIKALEQAMMDDQIIFLSSQKEVAIEEPKPKDIYRVGTLAKINQMLKLPNGTIRVLVEGLERAEIVKYIEEDEEFIVELDKLEDVYVDKHEQEALMRSEERRVGKMCRYQ